MNHIHPNDDGMDFDKFSGYHWDDGNLILKITLQSGKQFEASFTLIKKDRPIELAKYIRKEVVETKRGGYYEKWAKGILKHSDRTIRRMHQYYNCHTVYYERRTDVLVKTK